MINDRVIPVSTTSDKKILDRIDIVAHSMGYAHAQGMIDYLNAYMAKIDNKLFGRFYILAQKMLVVAKLLKKTLRMYGNLVVMKMIKMKEFGLKME